MDTNTSSANSSPDSRRPDKRERRSSEHTNLGSRKTSFMLGQAAHEALAELMPMWGFPSKGEAVTHALLYLLHQSKADAVSRLPLAQE